MLLDFLQEVATASKCGLMSVRATEEPLRKTAYHSRKAVNLAIGHPQLDQATRADVSAVQLMKLVNCASRALVGGAWSC